MASSLYQIPYDKITKDQRQIGKIIILGCGYQMGSKRFLEVAEGWGVEMSPGHAQQAVKSYRATYYLVAKLWAKLNRLFLDAVIYPDQTFTWRGFSTRLVKDKSNRVWLQFMLPSERAIYYCEPRLAEGEYGSTVVHMGRNPKTRQWSKRYLSPGRITENAVQAVARDILVNGIHNVLYKTDLECIGHVHDEIITLASEENPQESLDLLNQQMCEVPKWGKNLPIRAEGWYGKRYKK